ncbi:MAG: PDZ domain-containing protein [Aristaeellaceae bacterium]
MKKAVLCILLAAVAVIAVAAALPAFQPEQAEEESPAHAQRTAELGLMLLDEDNGLFVLAITEYSPAWRAGFQAGDLLLSSGDTPLTSVLQLEAMISSASGEMPVLLDRSGRQMSLMLPTY